MTKTQTTRRRASRSDGEATRTRILTVAGQRFAASGFADTTNKEIAAEAEVDLASINYHFGDRAGLYQAVLIEAHRRIADLKDIEKLAAGDLPASEKLRQLIRFLLGGQAGQTEWPMIVLGREIVAPSSHLLVLQSEEVLPKLRAILPIIGEITAIPQGDPALLRCLPCIAAPCVAFMLLGRSGTPIADQMQANSRDDLTDHLHGYAMGGLAEISRRYHQAKGERR